MAAKWIKHLDGLFCVTKKEASRSGQRSLNQLFFLYLPLSTLSVLLDQGWGRSRTRELDERVEAVTSSNSSAAAVLLAPPPFIPFDGEGGVEVGDIPY